MFGLRGGDGEVMSPKHALEDGFDTHPVGPQILDVWASGRGWPGDVAQACFWGWFGRLFAGASSPCQATYS